jgi:hypothetical protein
MGFKNWGCDVPNGNTQEWVCPYDIVTIWMMNMHDDLSFYTFILYNGLKSHTIFNDWAQIKLNIQLKGCIHNKKSQPRQHVGPL